MRPELTGRDDGDRRQLLDRRRIVYSHYLESVRPYMHHVRHWTGPYWEPYATTKDMLRQEEGDFDNLAVFNEMSDIELELDLIASEDARSGISWLVAQLLAFEATVIACELQTISVMGDNCEKAYDWMKWAFRIDLGVFSPEPSSRPPNAETASI